MVREGDVIEIPVIRHRFRILRSARETGGESLRLEWCAPPRGRAPEHVHPRQEARLQVVSGTLDFRVGGRKQTLSAGQSAVGPAGIPHAWQNLGAGEVCFRVEFRPALNTEPLLVAGSKIARDWGADKMGAPKYLLQLAMLLREVGDPHLYLTWPPVVVQKALLSAFTGVLAPVGRLLGYEARLPKRSGVKKSSKKRRSATIGAKDGSCTVRRVYSPTLTH